jgi:hypothetical protein
MLFKLSDQLNENIIKSPEGLPDEVCCMLNILALSVRSGEHYFFSNRKVLKCLSTLDRLDDISKRVFNYLYSNSSELKRIESIVSLRAILDFSDVIVCEVCSETGCKSIYIPIGELIDLHFIRATRLLCEDLNDTKLYEWITKYYLTKNSLRHIKINLNPQGGGGRNIERAFESIIDSRSEFCLCIVDSDKKSPDNDFGNTCKALQQHHNREEHFVCDIIPLDTREAENLVPFYFIENIYNEDCNYTEVISIHKDFFSKQNEARDYFDFKNGVKWKNIRNNQLASEKYWYRILEFENLLANINPDCVDEEKIILKGYNSQFFKKNSRIL